MGNEHQEERIRKKKINSEPKKVNWGKKYTDLVTSVQLLSIRKNEFEHENKKCSQPLQVLLGNQSDPGKYLSRS